MDRKQLKAEARAAVAASDAPLKKICLVFLVFVLGLAALEWGVGELIARAPQSADYLSRVISIQTRNYAIAMGVSLVSQLLLVLLWVGCNALGLDLSRRDPVDLSTLFEGFRIWPKAALLYLYISLMLGIWATILSLPASYVLSALYLSEMLTMDQIMNLMLVVMSVLLFILSYQYRTCYLILLDGPDKPIRQIAGEARLVTHSHKLQLFLLDLSFLPWYLLCILTCGILLVWKLPYFLTTYAGCYAFMAEDAKKLQQRLEEIREQQRQRMQRRF